MVRLQQVEHRHRETSIVFSLEELLCFGKAIEDEYGETAFAKDIFEALNVSIERLLKEVHSIRSRCIWVFRNIELETFVVSPKGPIDLAYPFFALRIRDNQKALPVRWGIKGFNGFRPTSLDASLFALLNLLVEDKGEDQNTCQPLLSIKYFVNPFIINNT